MVHTIDRMDEIYSCAVLWASHDADYPEEAPQEWQDTYALMKAAPMLKHLVELMADLIELRAYGDKVSAMTASERVAFKKSRKLLASLSPAKPLTQKETQP